MMARLRSQLPPSTTAVLALLLVNACVFKEAVGYGFLAYDDPWYVINNPLVRAPISSSTFASIFTAIIGGNWFPITLLSYRLDFAFGDLTPHRFHLTNLYLHLANSWLLLAFLRRLTRDACAATLAAALWAIHPLRVESVVWIAERKDVLSGFFGLLGLHAYLSYAARPMRWRYYIVLSTFTLGIMSKQILVTWPVVFLLLDYWPLGRLKRLRGYRQMGSVIGEKLPLFAISLLAGVITRLAQEPGSYQGISLSPWLQLSNALVSYIAYLHTTVFPFGLAIFYPMPENYPTWQVVLSAVGLVILGGLSTRAIERAPGAFVGWWWFVLVSLPTIGLVTFGRHARADRFTYLPAIGLSVCAAVGLAHLHRTTPRSLTAALRACTVIVVGLLAIRAHSQVQLWQSDEALWSHASDVTRDNYYALAQLGYIYRDRGDAERVIDVWRRSLEIRSDQPVILVDLVAELRSQGLEADAADVLETQARSIASNATLWREASRARFRQGRVSDGVAMAKRAYELDPSDSQSLELLLQYGAPLPARETQH